MTSQDNCDCSPETNMVDNGSKWTQIYRFFVDKVGLCLHKDTNNFQKVCGFCVYDFTVDLSSFKSQESFRFCMKFSYGQVVVDFTGTWICATGTWPNYFIVSESLLPFITVYVIPIPCNIWYHVVANLPGFNISYIW